MPFPNKDTQFKKGESGNPLGKPVGTKSLSTILKNMLEEEIDVELEDGTKQKKPFQDVIIRALIKQAKKGNMKAIQEIFDRVEGRPNQSIQVDGDMTIGITRRVVK